jgi:hypothetical protein
MIKNILLTTIILLYTLQLLTPKTVYAQGVCECSASYSSYGGQLTCSPPDPSTCNYGYTAKCSETTNRTCSCECIKEDNSTCGNLGQLCCDRNSGKSECFDNLVCEKLGYNYGKCVEAGEDNQFILDVCEKIEDPVAKSTCVKCMSFEGDSNAGVWTAIGCIRFSPEGFIEDVFSFAFGIVGGVAFLLLLAGAFTYLTASGNPEQLQKGKERLSSALAGLIFIILAVILLDIIGVDLLQIPGF